MRHLLMFVIGFAATTASADHELEDRNLANGQAHYSEHCASCHGKNLEGQPNWRTPDENGVLPAPPHDETGHTWHHDNALLFEYTQRGGEAALASRGVAGFTSGMPSFGETITDDDIWDILAYIRSTWSERVQEVQAARNRPHG